jgi:hypothetical protein
MSSLNSDPLLPLSAPCVALSLIYINVGVAYYDKDEYWTLHPTFGSWFFYRAVVTFDVPFPSSRIVPPPKRIVINEEMRAEVQKLTAKAKKRIGIIIRPYWTCG